MGLRFGHSNLMLKEVSLGVLPPSSSFFNFGGTMLSCSGCPCSGHGLCRLCVPFFSWVFLAALARVVGGVFLCPGCGLELSMVGMLFDMLGLPVCRVLFSAVLFRADAPFPMF